jgi:bacterioferritin
MPARARTLRRDLDTEQPNGAGGEAPTIADAQASPKEVPGPITAAYRADVKKVIERLNQLRSTEIVSYLQYKQHAYMAVSLLGPGIKSEFIEHADEELKHADMLAERIAQLGGVPLYDLCEIAQKAASQQVKPEQGVTLEQMVLADLQVERAQVEAYTTFIRQIGNDDPVTRRMLEDILIDTEHHASELRDMLQHRAD